MHEAAAELEASILDSPSAIGEQSDVVLITVPTDDDVRRVCFNEKGLFEWLSDGIAIINSSTKPYLPNEIQEKAPSGITVIDVPMCRGVWAAQEGNILFLVGGFDEVIEQYNSIFEACEEKTVLGQLGTGQVGKTASNLLLWISILSDYEVLRLADSLDVDPHKLREVLPESSGDNWAIREDHWENIQLTWPETDLAIALDLVDEADSPIPMSGLASQLMKGLSVSNLKSYYLKICECSY